MHRNCISPVPVPDSIHANELSVMLLVRNILPIFKNIYLAFTLLISEEVTSDV